MACLKLVKQRPPHKGNRNKVEPRTRKPGKKTWGSWQVGKVTVCWERKTSTLQDSGTQGLRDQFSPSAMSNLSNLACASSESVYSNVLLRDMKRHDQNRPTDRANLHSKDMVVREELSETQKFQTSQRIPWMYICQAIWLRPVRISSASCRFPTCQPLATQLQGCSVSHVKPNTVHRSFGAFDPQSSLDIFHCISSTGNQWFGYPPLPKHFERCSSPKYGPIW